MKIRNILVLLSMCAFVSNLEVFAQSGSSAGSGSNSIPMSKQERKLAKFDTNGDGVLDKNEKARARSMRASRRQHRLERMRKLGIDPKVVHQRKLQRFDANHDGKLEPNEKAAAHAYHQQHKHGKYGPSSSSAPPQSSSPPPSTGVNH